MTLTVHPRRHGGLASAATFVAIFALMLGVGSPAGAQPDEDGSPKVAALRKNLENAAAGYLEAEAKIAESKKRQASITKEYAAVELTVTRLKKEVAVYAAEVYRTGRIGVFGVLLSSNSGDGGEGFLGRARALNSMTMRDQARLSELVEQQRRATTLKQEIDAEVEEQAKQLRELKKRRQAAERALSAVGGYATTGWVDPTSPLAVPAKRNADGSWLREGCIINDPTTGGCITPRTLHALEQAQVNGFTRFVGCYRVSSWGEHPKGRACDFSADKNGFVDASAWGDSKLYGDKLASFFVKNAGRLGVMYVIWYCKIWLYGSGWRTYNSAGSNCGDSPAGDHTNHVHLSMY